LNFPYSKANHSGDSLDVPGAQIRAQSLEFKCPALGAYVEMMGLEGG
jgi:hypothetical protein